jgi:hypothetical protein
VTDAGVPPDLQPVVLTYTLPDIYAGLLHAWRRFLRMLIVVELFWIVLIIGVALLNGATVVESLSNLPWKLLVIGGVLLVVFWFGICPLIGYFRMRRSGVIGPNQVTVTDRGIKLVTPRAESLVYWSGIRRTVLTSERFYLFLVTAGAIIVPRRSFGDVSDFSSFAAAARQKWERARAE